MEAFKTHTGLVAVLNRGNIDTDQLIPKDFLKSIKRTGYGEHLFDDWRYLADGRENPDFELNAPRYKGASILVTGNNFGCGSSREHAVWAVVQAGYKAVIAPKKETATGVIPGFADIFKNNSGKNGLLTIELAEDQVKEMIEMIQAHEGLKATVDLEAQKIILQFADVAEAEGEKEFSFDIEETLKQHFLEGLDEIGQSLKYNKEISEFEKKHSSQI